MLQHSKYKKKKHSHPKSLCVEKTWFRIYRLQDKLAMTSSWITHLFWKSPLTPCPLHFFFDSSFQIHHIIMSLRLILFSFCFPVVHNYSQLILILLLIVFLLPKFLKHYVKLSHILLCENFPYRAHRVISLLEITSSAEILFHLLKSTKIRKTSSFSPFSNNL